MLYQYADLPGSKCAASITAAYAHYEEARAEKSGGVLAVQWALDDLRARIIQLRDKTDEEVQAT